MEPVLSNLQSLQKRKSIEVHYNPLGGWLYVNWLGYQDENTVKEGGELILKAVQEKSCAKILNDNREVKGTWTKAAAWTEEVFFPRLIQSGVKKFAWIQSPDVFSKHSIAQASKNQPLNSPIDLKIFDRFELAVGWLEGDGQ